MSLAFAPSPRPPVPEAAASGFSVAAAEPGPRRVEAGELIALPILPSPGGTPLDLDLVAAGRSAVVLILPAAAPRADASGNGLLARARVLATAASAVLIVVAPTLAAALAAPSGTVAAIDAGRRFAHMLGLGDAGSRDRAEPGAALLVVNEVGCVTRVETGPPAG